jgi:hypothetical protein
MSKKALWIAVVVVLTAFVAVAPAGCWLSFLTGPTDPYEPNNDLNTATVLTPGTALSAAISKGGQTGDFDVYRCDMPLPGSTAFRVLVQSSQAENLEVEVGISLPQGWEGITWPGWNPRRAGESIIVDGDATEGTLLIFVSGTKPAAYSITLEPPPK